MNKKRAAVVLGLIATGFVVGRYTGTGRHDQAAAAATTRHILYYIDPMHPSYRSSKPGTAPDCGMALEPVYEGDDSVSKLQLTPGAVAINSERQQLIGVRLETAEPATGTRLLRTTGRVEADETRVHRVMAGTEGWVQSV